MAVAVSARGGAPEDTSADTRVVALFEDEPPAGDLQQQLVDSGEAKPGLRKVAVAHEDAPGGGSSSKSATTRVSAEVSSGAPLRALTATAMRRGSLRSAPHGIPRVVGSLATGLDPSPALTLT